MSKSSEESIINNKKLNSKNVDQHLKTRNEKLNEKGYLPTNVNSAPPSNKNDKNDKEKKKKTSWWRKSKKEQVVEVKLPPQIGVSLEELYNRTRSIPEIITECILNAKSNLETEGLFRVPGDVQKMKEIEKHLHIGDFQKLDPNVNQHTSASILKQFFRELPEPLFTFQLHTQFLETIKLGEEDFVRENLRLINSLPFSHRLIMITLLPFLREITQYSSKNLMNEGNLGIVFGPTLMKSIEETTGFVDMTNKKANYIEMLIMYSEKIIPNINMTQDLVPGIGLALNNLSSSSTTNSPRSHPNNIPPPLKLAPNMMLSPTNGSPRSNNSPRSTPPPLININPLKIVTGSGPSSPRSLSPRSNNSPRSNQSAPNLHNNVNVNLKTVSGPILHNQPPPLNNSQHSLSHPNLPLPSNIPPPITSLPPPITYQGTNNSSPTLSQSQPVKKPPQINSVPPPINYSTPTHNTSGNNLSQSQQTIPTNLQQPSDQTSYINAVVMYNFTGDPQKGQIDLIQNAQAIIHSKYPGGWAYGFSNGKSGYFPCSYVKEL